MPPPVQTILEQRARRSTRRQQTTAAAVAIGLHVFAVGAAFALPRLLDRQREFPEYVAVQLIPAGALEARPATAPKPTAPAPEPTPPEPEPIPEPNEPPPPPKSAPDPEIPVLPRPAEKPPQPQPQPRSAPQQAPAPVPKTPAPQPRQPAAGTGGLGEDTVTRPGDPRLGAQAVGPGGASFPYDYYLVQMLGKIRQSWVRPPVEGIETLISFRVLRNGEVVAEEIRASSGSRAFDLAALRAVRNASPFPPLPASYREGELTVNLIVR